MTGSTRLQGATIGRPVTVMPGGALAVQSTHLNSGITANGAAAVRVCASTVHGAVSLNKTTGFVLLGDGSDHDDVGAAPCGADTMQAAVSIVNSSGPVELGDDAVTGAISLTGTTGPAAELEANHVTGSLWCGGNVPPPTDDGQPNLAVTKAGQCGSPGF